MTLQATLDLFIFLKWMTFKRAFTKISKNKKRKNERTGKRRRNCRKSKK